MKQEPTEDSVIIRSMLGFCQHAPSDLDKHKCPGRYQRWYSGKVKSGRKSVDGLVYIDEYVQCTCMCHVPEDERPKPKARRKTAKKAAPKTRRKK